MTGPVQLSRLAPAAPEAVADAFATLRPWEHAPPGRPFVFLNMIATADGRAARGGGTRELGGPADIPVLLELRTRADAVLVGTGTLRVEGYGRLIRRPERRARREALGLAADPLAVVLSRSLDVPWDAALFTTPEQPVLLYTSADAPAPPGGVAASVEVIALPDLSPAAALADLRARGVRALLCEGGPRLNRALLAGGLVDELFLTLAPLLTGDEEPRIVEGEPLPAAAGLALRWVLQHEDELYLRYAVSP